MKENFNRASFETMKAGHKKEEEQFIDGAHKEALKENEKRKLSEIRSDERSKYEELFRHGIDVEPMPEEVTIEKIEKWKKLGFSLNYLPDVDMLHETMHVRTHNPYRRYTEGRELRSDIFDRISSRPDKGWVLIEDSCKSKIFDDVIKKMIKDGLVEDKKLGSLHYTERKQLSFNDLANIEVKKCFAEVLGVDAEKICLPKIIEYNLLKNRNDLSWVNFGSDDFEMFDDVIPENLGKEKDGSKRYAGFGYSHEWNPGFESRSKNSSGSQFRLMVRLSGKRTHKFGEQGSTEEVNEAGKLLTPEQDEMSKERAKVRMMEEAIEYEKKNIEHIKEGSNRAAQKMMAEIWVRAGNLEKAEKYYLYAGPYEYPSAARKFEEIGELEMAKKFWTLAAENPTGYGDEIGVMAAGYWEKAGNLAKAIESYEKAIRNGESRRNDVLKDGESYRQRIETLQKKIASENESEDNS